MRLAYLVVEQIAIASLTEILKVMSARIIESTNKSCKLGKARNTNLKILELLQKNLI